MADLNGVRVNNAILPDVQRFIALGVDPKTKLPAKITSSPETLKFDIKKILRIIDEQDAIRRYTWYNLPDGITSELLERILYYRGQAMLFYLEDVDKFYFLPYALSGDIDVYGRYTKVTPVPFTGAAGDTGDDDEKKAWITGLLRKPFYEVPDVVTLDDALNGCVLLHDYCKQMSQRVLPRQTVNDCLLDVMAECLPYARTALINATGVNGMRVQSEDEYSAVLDASRSVNKASLKGEKWIPIVGNVEFQDLTPGNVARSEEFLMTMQSIDNLRLATYGLDNGGLFEKQSHILQSEEALNGHKAQRAYNDGLMLRQEFCDIVNSIWQLGIACEPSETEFGDVDLDGMGVDELDQSGAYEGDQPQEMEANNA